MATKIVSANVNKSYEDVSIATGSATTAAMEVTFDLVKVKNKAALMHLLEQVKNRLSTSSFPPSNT